MVLDDPREMVTRTKWRGLASQVEDHCSEALCNITCLDQKL